MFLDISAVLLKAECYRNHSRMGMSQSETRLSFSPPISSGLGVRRPRLRSSWYIRSVTAAHSQSSYSCWNLPGLGFQPFSIIFSQVIRRMASTILFSHWKDRSMLFLFMKAKNFSLACSFSVSEQGAVSSAASRQEDICR